MTTESNELSHTVAALAALSATDRKWVLAQLPPAQHSEIAALLAARGSPDVEAAVVPDEVAPSPAAVPEAQLLQYVARLPPALAARVVAAAPLAWTARLRGVRAAEEGPEVSPAWGEKTPAALWAIVLARAQAMPLHAAAARRRRWTWGRSG